MDTVLNSFDWEHHKARVGFAFVMAVCVFVWVSLGGSPHEGIGFGQEAVQQQFFVQTIGVGLSLVCITCMYTYFYDETKMYARIGKLTSHIRPEPFIHLHPRRKDHWAFLGLDSTVVVAVVAIVIMHIPRIAYNGLQVDLMMKIMPMAIVFSFINACTEEVLMRLGIIVALKGIMEDKKIAIVCGIFYGITQYWSPIGGFLGMITGGFLGWFLAKSILETRGVFWAWMIHFVRDVLMFSGFFLLSLDS